ncbi:hypothetical protein G9A89_019026 [Geosiphon pyriformis]|nr:hypothetical protein G9A89_019026 [Geosiphon pyriformis]
MARDKKFMAKRRISNEPSETQFLPQASSSEKTSSIASNDSDHTDRSETPSKASNKENNPESSKSGAIRAVLEENSLLKKEIARLQAEIAFKNQVIESLQAETKQLNPGLTCVVCVEYMTNPCTISCGHTFCYECLRDWTKIRRECPTCRKKITHPPTLSFLVKQQVETFVERLPADEREIANQRLKTKEEMFNNLEDPWMGLFAEPASAIIDIADGVRRCSRCAWEVVGSRCIQCGLQYQTDGNEELTDSEIDVDEMIADSRRHDWEYDLDDTFIDQRTTEEILSDDSYTSEEESFLDDHIHEQEFDGYESESAQSTGSSESTGSTSSTSTSLERRGAQHFFQQLEDIMISGSSSGPAIISISSTSSSGLPTRFTRMSISPQRSRETDLGNQDDDNETTLLPIQHRRSIRRLQIIESDSEIEDINDQMPNDSSSSLSRLQSNSTIRSRPISNPQNPIIVDRIESESESEQDIENSEEVGSEENSDEILTSESDDSGSSGTSGTGNLSDRSRNRVQENHSESDEESVFQPFPARIPGRSSQGKSIIRNNRPLPNSSREDNHGVNSGIGQARGFGSRTGGRR